MAPEYLHARLLPAAHSPQPAAAGEPSGPPLAELQALLVELLHEAKRTNDLLAKQSEIERQAALKLEKISLQTHVCAVQLGRLVERT